jgi:hypothetical protein
LIVVYLVIAIFLAIIAAYMTRGIQEGLLGDKQRLNTEAFYAAEAGIQKVLWLVNHRQTITSSTGEVYNRRDGNRGVFNVVISDDGSLYKNITSQGTAYSGLSQATRTIQVRLERYDESSRLVGCVSSALYSNGAVRLRFDERDYAYIDGKEKPGIYGTGSVRANKEGEGHIFGNPDILEDESVPEGLTDGIWDTFNFNALREIAKANDTYFSADDTNDEYNNPYNRNHKYTLPIVKSDGTKVTNGVFFFDASKGNPLDDSEVNPKNEVRLKLQGTTEPVSGIIVVVGDLTIQDTDDYDFLFNGVILALDDLKIDDKRHGRRSQEHNDSDIYIQGAVLSDNIITEGKGRLKKAGMDITNATIEYNRDAIVSAIISNLYYWRISAGSWKEVPLYQ